MMNYENGVIEEDRGSKMYTSRLHCHLLIYTNPGLANQGPLKHFAYAEGFTFKEKRSYPRSNSLTNELPHNPFELAVVVESQF